MKLGCRDRLRVAHTPRVGRYQRRNGVRTFWDPQPYSWPLGSSSVRSSLRDVTAAKQGCGCQTRRLSVYRIRTKLKYCHDDDGWSVILETYPFGRGQASQGFVAKSPGCPCCLSSSSAGHAHNLKGARGSSNTALAKNSPNTNGMSDTHPFRNPLQLYLMLSLFFLAQ